MPQFNQYTVDKAEIANLKKKLKIAQDELLNFEIVWLEMSRRSYEPSANYDVLEAEYAKKLKAAQE